MPITSSSGSLAASARSIFAVLMMQSSLARRFHAFSPFVSSPHLTSDQHEVKYGGWRCRDHDSAFAENRLAHLSRIVELLLLEVRELLGELLRSAVVLCALDQLLAVGRV